MTLVLAAGYVAVAALLLSLNVASRWHVSVKLLAVFVVGALYVATYLGLKHAQGWPSDEPLPDAFRLHWVTVEEPDKRTGNDGVIYFWVGPFQEEGDTRSRGGAPRAYRTGYSAEKAESALAARGRIEAGGQVAGFMTRQLVDPSEAEIAEGEARESTGELSLAGEDGDLLIEFRDIPLPTLPKKALVTD